MARDIEEARKEVHEVYAQLWETMKETVNNLTAPLDLIVADLSKGINLFSNQELWDFQLRLGIEAYRLGNIKEQGSLKEACAEALYKEGLAQSYSAADGTSENKKQQSIINSMDKQVVAMLYASMSSLLKTKCDEAHRLVNILQGIQISRAAEAKTNASPRSEGDKLLLE